MTKEERVKEYRSRGIIQVPFEEMDKHQVFLEKQLALIRSVQPKPRPWHYWELHNPWSRSALVTDSWGFLDLCESKELTAILTPLAGPDLILYDSQFSPDLAERGHSSPLWTSDGERCPVDPLAGIVVRIPLASEEERGISYSSENGEATTSTGETLQILPGHLVCHDIRLRYQKQSPYDEYVIRYFPATSRYIRELTAPIHLQLTESFPLLNYARMPLWLVCGEDRANNDFVTGFNPKAARWIGQTNE